MTEKKEETSGPKAAEAEATAEEPSVAETRAEQEPSVQADPVEPREPDQTAREDSPPEDDFEFADPIVDTGETAAAAAEEVHHASLSARILQGLVLIALGAALALWGGPKLAPYLPAGLSPVADFLKPGLADAREEVAALRAEVEARLAALEAQPSSGLTREDIDAALAEYDARLQAELAEIKDRLAATDGEAIEARLAALETRVEGIAAELATVSERLSRQITENGVALSEEAASRLAEYQAALEGLRAEVRDLAARNGALSQKVEEIAAAAARRIEEAQAEASNKVASSQIRKILAEIDAALESGSPFAKQLEELRSVAGVEVPEALAAVAETGTSSWTTLRNSFSDKAYAALRAEARASAGEGMGARLRAFLRAQVATRSLERREGNDTDAILSRVEDDLVNRRLSSALAEAETLSEPARAAMADWIEDLRKLAAARAAYAELSEQLGAGR